MKKINLTDYIQKSGETLRLTETERTKMKHMLSEYMSVKPIRGNLAARRTPIKTAWIELYMFSRKSVAVVVLGALLLSGAGVSYAAEGAVPGDILYPLKVGVNEPVAGALSVSAEAKASWNATLAERRLEEAEKLASENKLTDDKKAELVARFDEHADAATNDIQKLEDRGSSSAIGIASDFETTLAAHETILSDVDGNKSDSVKMRVRAKALAISKVREKAEEDVMVSAPADESAVAMALSVPAPTSLAPMSAKVRIASEVNAVEQAHSDETKGVRTEVAQKMGTSAKSALLDLKKMFARVQAKLSADTQANVTAQLASEASLIQAGDTAFASGDSASAFRSYQEASVNAGKLSVFLKAFLKLRIKNFPVERPILQNMNRVSADDVNQNQSTENKGDTNAQVLPLPVQILPGDSGSGSGSDSNTSEHGGDSSSGEKIETESHGGDNGVKIQIGI